MIEDEDGHTTHRRTATMRIKPYYLAPVLASGAAAAAIIAAPSAIVAPARPQQAGIVTTPMTGPHTGGSYCADFCGSYNEYGYYRGAPGIPTRGPSDR
jgi:hypothetical protein